MNKNVHAAVVAVVLAVSGGMVLAEEHQEHATTRELMEQVRDLKAQVERLQSAQHKTDERLSVDEVDGTAKAVLTDAEQRSQLLQATGFTAGYSKGKFIIQSEDGNFLLNPQLQLQARYILNYRDEDAANPVDGRPSTEDGLELRRMKLNFEGHVFSPDTTYKFQWATIRSSGTLELEEAFVKHRFATSNWAVKGGQYKDVTFHEELASSKRQLAVERSLLNQFLGGGQTKYIQGVGAIWDDGTEGLPLRAEVGYTDGPNTRNTNFTDGGGSSFLGVASPDYGAYGRAEYLLFGDWKQYDDFTAMGNKQDMLVLGAGAFYTEAGSSYALQHTVDAQYETKRLGLYAAYVGVISDTEAGGNGYNWGLLAQAGFMIGEKWEPFVRYDYMSLDNISTPSGEDSFHEITAGVNYYWHGHAAKFTADVVWLPSGTPANADGLGILAPDAGDDQFVFRAQFQLLL